MNSKIKKIIGLDLYSEQYISKGHFDKEIKYKTFLKIKLASRRTEKNTIKIVEEERFCSFFLIGSLVKTKI